MSARDLADEEDLVDRAVNRVLTAEREAEEAVARCRREAARITCAAEHEAQRLAERTEQRVKLAQRIADLAVERAVAQLHAQKSAAGATLAEAEVGDLLERTVGALVEEILSG
jgi:hypothetical protein